jgi:hypothetical protein
MLLTILWWYFIITVVSIGLLALMVIYDICVYGNWYYTEDSQGKTIIPPRSGDG